MRNSMSRLCILAVFALLACLALSAQTPAPAATKSPAPDLTGTWRGQLALADQSLPIVIHIAKDDSGKYSVYADNPTDGSQIAGTISVQDAKVHFEFEQGIYDGALNDAGDTIDGAFDIGSGGMPCPLKRDKSN